MFKTPSYQYRLGLPAWAFEGWQNKYFEAKPSRLASYATVFNSVEGNTTFYQIPSEKSVREWSAELMQKDFKICFKLPKEVTHKKTPDWEVLRIFLKRIECLRNNLGPLLLVFPAKVSPAQSAFIDSILSRIPDEFHFVVEVRHLGFFVKNNALSPILDKFRCHRVILDSRPIYFGDQHHPDVVLAKHEKPNVPVATRVFNNLAYIRLIMHPGGQNSEFINQWATLVANYLQNDIETYMSIHCPNKLCCPEYAQQFHSALQKKLGTGKIEDLPTFPVPQQSNLLQYYPLMCCHLVKIFQQICCVYSAFRRKIG
ncbi:MAG: DUF72 domain-containing protein [Pseudomonadota bacterium]